MVERSDPKYLFSDKAREMDHERLAWFAEGRHDRVLDTMDEFLTVRPEGKFAHYLMMAAALGEGDFCAPGRQISRLRELHRHEPGARLVRPPGDRMDAQGSRCMTEYRRILLEGAPVQTVRHGDELVAADGRTVGVDDAIHLPPVEPTKIIAVHLNYDSRTQEFMTKLPAAPTYFHKPITALNSHKGAVVRPERCKWLNYEGEIVIVIGRTCRNVSPEEAGDYIAGYTVGNDYGLHDFRDTDAGSMLRVKGSDTLAPIGPGLVTGWDFRDKGIQTRVNGVVKQDSTTAEMEWDMHYLVADIARTITLVPGDILFSGTPAFSRTVYPGDVVEVEVEGLGTLSNTIVQGPTPIRDDCGAQPTESEEVVSTAMGGDWEFRGIRTPSKDLYPSTVEEKEQS